MLSQEFKIIRIIRSTAGKLIINFYTAKEFDTNNIFLCLIKRVI